MRYVVGQTARVRNCGSSIAEFGPALFIILCLIVPFVIAMLSLLDAAATLYFATAAAARSAAPSNTFSEAKKQYDSCRYECYSRATWRFRKDFPS